MDFQTLIYRKQAPLAYIVLNRPQETNVISRQVIQDLTDVCAAIHDDPEVRAVILSGEGSAFCQGWDMGELAQEAVPDPLPLLDHASLVRGFSMLSELSKPVICAINGDAVSAGLELALACDVRLACPEAHFALPEVTWGLIPIAGGTQRLPRIVGRAHALRLILTADTIDAQEAHRIGLVSAVVPRDRLLAEAEAVAERIAQRGPLAVQFAKEVVQRGLDMTLEQALRYETDLTIILQTTQDRAEGVRAFVEKRPPNFTGR